MSKLIQVKYRPSEALLTMAESISSESLCASRLKVLADETRLSVVQQLLEGPKHVGEINAKVRLEQSRLSHHLKVLRDSGLVISQRDGKAVLYRLAPDVEVARDGKAINLGCCSISFEETN